MNDTPLGWRLQLALGAGLAVAVCKAVHIDYVNNVAYGASISPEAAAALGMSAILVAALPATAAIMMAEGLAQPYSGGKKPDWCGAVVWKGGQ